MSLEKIANAVEVDGGVKQFTMREIKQEAAPRRERLSAPLCEQIRADLHRMGCGVLPSELPTREEEPVLVYAHSGVVGRLVHFAYAAAMQGEAGGPMSVAAVLQQVPELAGLLDWCLPVAREPASDVAAS